jgi:hypothetical protein
MRQRGQKKMRSDSLLKAAVNWADAQIDNFSRPERSFDVGQIFVLPNALLGAHNVRWRRSPNKANAIEISLRF